MAENFYTVLTAAVSDITEHGFDSAGRLDFWADKLREAAKKQMLPEYRMDEMLRNALGAIYTKLVERGEIARFHSGISRFTIQRVAPRLRAELDRRIMASANLIKLNRQEAIETTIRRFQGWGSSIPAGGSNAVDKSEVKTAARKALASLPFDERRVIIDQSHKLKASLNNILATDGGAIALIWHSHWRQANYNYREDHKERDGQVYLLRESWARERGLVRPSGAGFYDQITAVGEEVFCRCYAQYLYHLRDLPPDMITAKGREELDLVKKAIA